MSASNPTRHQVQRNSHQQPSYHQSQYDHQQADQLRRHGHNSTAATYPAPAGLSNLLMPNDSEKARALYASHSPYGQSFSVRSSGHKTTTCGTFWTYCLWITNWEKQKERTSELREMTICFKRWKVYRRKLASQSVGILSILGNHQTTDFQAVVNIGMRGSQRVPGPAMIWRCRSPSTEGSPDFYINWDNVRVVVKLDHGGAPYRLTSEESHLLEETRQKLKHRY